MNRQVQSLALLGLALLAVPAAHAQMAVVDVQAVAQLLSQVRTLEQQLTTARNHLLEAQSELQSMTGSRGMERLLAGTVRNYLPTDWNELTSAAQGASASYGALSNSWHSALSGLSVLSPPQLAMLSTAAQQRVNAGRTSAALLQAVMQQALITTSARFASLQALIDSIPKATDQKSILELQARIGTEQNMLQNEQTKLQVLYQGVAAQQGADQEREAERAVLALGQFTTRFQPVP